MADEQVEKQQVVVGETKAGDNKVANVPVHAKKGVLMKHKTGEEFWVRPESVRVWLKQDATVVK